MSPRHHLRALASRADFRRLYRTRIVSQIADGVFQASLAGTVLFNPDRQTDPLAIALGFAALLLPYSFIGPFVGVLLDRWKRRDVLVFTNVVRMVLIPLVAAFIWFGTASIVFILLALVVVAIGRFYTAALSAALPHVTSDEQLVTANSFSTTSGTIAFSVGIAGALGLRQIFGASDHGYAGVSLCATVGYLLAACVAARFERGYLGPEHPAPDRLRFTRQVRAIMGDFLGGAHHLKRRPLARTAMIAACAQRACYGIATLMLLLLYRNYFTDDGIFRAHEAGLGQVVAASALGAFVAAALTPWASRRLGASRWVLALLIVGAVAPLALGTPFSLPLLLPAVFVIGLVAQSAKIVADATVQHECDDGYQGRVFSLYDMFFNVCFVVGMLVAALTLPTSGKSYAVLWGVAVFYAVLAVWYGWASRLHPRAAGKSATAQSVPAAPAPVESMSDS